MYKQKLYMLLKALEVQEIEELMEKPSPYLVSVGLEIAKAARLGAPFLSASNKPLHSDTKNRCPLCKGTGKAIPCFEDIEQYYED